MSIEIYTPDYSNRHEVTHADSLQMQKLYNGIGKFQLSVAANDYFASIIQEDGLLYYTERDTPFTIQDVWKDTVKNQIIAKGYTANWLLNHRAITAKKSIGVVEKDLYETVTANLRGLPKVSVAKVKGLAAKSSAVLFGGQLLDKAIDVLAEAEYGNQMRWNDDTRRLTFEIYQGRDLTPKAAGIHAVVFSEGQGTAKDLVFESDKSTFKNYFYVPVKYSDGTEGVVEYGDKKVPDLREYWLTSTMTQTKDETKPDFIKRAQWKCQEEAEKRLKRQRFNVKIDPEELGTRFNIGDKVACASERLGISFEARITGATFQLDANGEKTEINLGEPKMTALREVILNG